MKRIHDDTTRAWHPREVSGYWDQAAPRYLELFRGEFSAKPFDQQIIGSFAATLPAGGRVLDAGCGPSGEVARMLSDHALDVTAIDISRQCVALARKEQPSLSFEVMDMSHMTFDTASFDGLIAYYALHYQPRATFSATVREFARVLRPRGMMLLIAKEGFAEGWTDDPLGVAPQVFWCATERTFMHDVVGANGFTDLRCQVREALPDEIDAPRVYVMAKRKHLGM